MLRTLAAVYRLLLRAALGYRDFFPRTPSPSEVDPGDQDITEARSSELLASRWLELGSPRRRARSCTPGETRSAHARSRPPGPRFRRAPQDLRDSQSVDRLLHFEATAIDLFRCVKPDAFSGRSGLGDSSRAAEPSKKGVAELDPDAPVGATP